MTAKATEAKPAPSGKPQPTATSTNGMAREYMVGELMKALLKQMRAADKPWLNLSEKQQAKVLKEIEIDVSEAVEEAVSIIASDGRTRFKATCEKVAFDGGGVKASLAMLNTQEAHALADAAGKSVLICIGDAADYKGLGPTAPVAEADQRALFDKSQQAKKSNDETGTGSGESAGGEGSGEAEGQTKH